MPKAVKEIQLVCTPEEWEVLCLIWDFHSNEEIQDCGVEYKNPHLHTIKDKISAINKRLVFASSISD